MSNAVAVPGNAFDKQVLRSDIPVLVDFWAEWCGPCRQIAPVIDALAAEYVGRLKVVKIDVEESPEIASRYGVQGIPTLILFKNGKVVDQVIGVVPKNALASKIEALTR